jgi:Metal binding domain of Ada
MSVLSKHTVLWLSIAAWALVCTPVMVAKAQPSWPNLDTLRNYPTPAGTTCRLEGSGRPGSEKGNANALKNRYKLPPNGFESLLLSDIINLPSGTPDARPTSADPNNQRAVTVVGYVREVKPGGTAGESCNCRAKGRTQVDAHIEVVLDPNSHDPSGKGMVVVEVQERIRRLARQGLLTSNIGKDWSTPILRARLLGRWVKFSGWLFYDADHHLESWQVDTTNTLDGANWRETGWEIHPVMAMETGVQPPPDARSSGTPPAPSGGTGEVRGNKHSKVYHLPGCPGFEAMSPAHVVTFASEAEAQQAGYRKARNCP